ncbi:MAG: hypothetical protein KDA44_03960 [Planctomycetales bacterium]|nr:hypothetical protein [Planctomycetales bacterium]
MATIFKSNSPPQASGATVRGVAFSLADISGQAEQYVAGVRQETGKIVSGAQAQADEIRRQAEEAGRQAAEQAALKTLDQNVAQRMNTVLPALQSAVAQLTDAKHDWQRWWEAQALGLARAMAERIVRAELSVRPEIQLTWVREALELAAGAGEITLQLAPGDVETLSGQIEQLTEMFASAATVRIVPDARITPGGCRVVTEFGVIDEQLETQLARLEEELGG